MKEKTQRAIDDRKKPVENVLKMLKMAPVAMKIILKLVFYSCMKAIRQEIEKNVCRRHDTFRPRDTKQNKATTVTTVPKE